MASLESDPEDVDVPTSPGRLAGVGAALGGCFSLMLIAVVGGTAGALTGPRESAATADRPAEAAAPDTALKAAARLLDARSTSVRSVSATTLNLLREAERTVMLADADVAAAETKLMLLRYSARQAALQQASRRQSTADQVAAGESPHSWISREEYATRTRQLALSQLHDDLKLIRSRVAKAEEEVDRLRIIAQGARRTLETLMAEVEAFGSTATALQPGSVAPDLEASAGDVTPASGDLLETIDRHRRSLISRQTSGPLQP